MSREAFEAWERDNNITFVSRSSGQYTTVTVSRDALRNLWQAARAAALEEAAEIADAHATCEGIGQRIAEEIRALKEQG